MARRETEFGGLLKQYRLLRNVSLKELGHVVRRSHSFIQKVESSLRKHDLSREEVWRIITYLRVWPPACDNLLRNAGFSADRTGIEEQEVQRSMPFAELWVFARQILDPDSEWYNVVDENLQQGRRYRYFTADAQRFARLHRFLRTDLAKLGQNPDTILVNQLECFVLPEDLFLSNFALYLPPPPDIDKGRPSEMTRIYGCGTKPVRGRADVFFTMSEDEAETLFKVLQGWRDRVLAGEDIFLSPVSQIFPPDSRKSKFVATDMPTLSNEASK